MLKNINEIEKDYKLQRILDTYNLDLNDLLRLGIYYHNFISREENEEATIKFISKSLNMSEKNIKKLFTKGKTDTINKYFLNRLFNKKLNVKVDDTFVGMSVDKVSTILEYTFERLVLNYTKEDYEKMAEESIIVTAKTLTVFMSSTNSELISRYEEFVEILKEKNKLESTHNLLEEFFKSFLIDINRFLFNEDIENRIKPNLEAAVDLIEDQHNYFNKMIKEKEIEIENLTKENEDLKEQLTEAIESLEKLNINRESKLIDKKVLVLGDQGRARDYYNELKKFGLKEKNYFHLNGMTEASKTKNYKNVDVVILFTTQCKHKADMQLNDFSNNTQIIKVNRTGLRQLHNAILQIC